MLQNILQFFYFFMLAFLGEHLFLTTIYGLFSYGESVTYMNDEGNLEEASKEVLDLHTQK